jgi:hypothetical protein
MVENEVLMNSGVRFGNASLIRWCVPALLGLVACGGGDGSHSNAGHDGGPAHSSSGGPASSSGGVNAHEGPDGGFDAGPVMTPINLPSNPVTMPLTAADCSGTIYSVASDSDIDAVHWSALRPGDCVNITKGTTPYTRKFCLSTAATAAAPLIVHGVTDASGNRPVFDFGASTTTTAPDCDKVFDSSSQYDLETEGGIVITGPQFTSSDPTYNPPPPSFVHVENLELHDANAGGTFTGLTGAQMTYDGLASGVYVQLGTDLLVDNCVIYDCTYGIFTQAKDDTLAGATQRMTIQSNRIYGCGTAGGDLTHNLYIQSTNPVVQGNYFGQTRPMSLGSTYKSRSSGEVFRYNYVVASARALDFVQSENDDMGILIQPDYGQDYVYGNIIVNDMSTPNGAAVVPIHYGGDNLGEDNNATQSMTVEGTCSSCVPPGQYRSHLFFYDNLFWSNAGMGLVDIFEPSLQSTEVYVWNNIFSLNGAAYYSWLEYAGTVNLLGNNLANVISGGMVYNSDDDSYLALWGASEGTDTLFKVVKDPAGMLLTASPAFVGPTTYNFHLMATSPAIGQGTHVPASLPATTPGYGRLTSLPVNEEPLMETNGLVPRATTADLGPEEP